MQESLIKHTPVNTTETSASKSKGNSKNENTASVLNRGIFTKDVHKLLNKNLNFVPTQKAFDKKTFDKEMTFMTFTDS